MPGSSTTPGRPGARTHAPVRVAFRFRNGVSTRDMNLCEAQWLAYVLPYRRFAAALTGSRARLRADVDRYSVIVSDLHRLLVAGLPAHCERFWTLPRGHARALWDGFSVEVDGGSNRGAYQGGELGLADGDAARALLKARRSARRLTVRKNPRRNRPIEMQDLPPSSNCGDDNLVSDAKRWEMRADRVGDVAWRNMGVVLFGHPRVISGRCRGRCSPSCRTSARACESRRR